MQYIINILNRAEETRSGGRQRELITKAITALVYELGELSTDAGVDKKDTATMIKQTVDQVLQPTLLETTDYCDGRR